MTKIVSYRANENDFHVFKKSKNHKALFTFSVGSSNGVGPIEHEPHVFKIDEAFSQDFPAFYRIEAEAANSIKQACNL